MASLGERFSGRSVLTIDDSATIRVLLRTILAGHGAQVDEAGDGRSGLRMCVRKRYDLILLDLLLPDMNGLEVLEQLRSSNDESTVVMLTGSGGIRSATAAVRQGADGYLEKHDLSALSDLSEFFLALEQALQYRAGLVANVQLRRQLDEKHRQLEVELARAGEVQAGLLPRSYPCLPGFEFAARFLPAREVSGDFYDWYEPAPGVVTFTLGDISGKGLPAAIMMATVRAAMRAVVRQSAPADAMRNVSLALGVDLERSERYVTLFLGQLDFASQRLAFVDAGHGHVFVLRRDGAIARLLPRGLPMGILPDETYEQGVLDFAAGDALVLYSDGLIDAQPKLELDPTALAAALAGASSAEEMAERLIKAAAPAGALPDDLTVLVLYCKG